MIVLSEAYLINEGGKSKLCTDLKGKDISKTLFFMTDQDTALNCESGESFVMAVLPYAMERGEDITYSGSLSERFVHGLNEYLIPSMTARSKYRRMRVKSKFLLSEKHKDDKGVGIRVSLDADFYEITKVGGKDSLYPLTHLCVIDDGCSDVDALMAATKEIAEAKGLCVAVIEHNISCIYDMDDKDKHSFAELASALALGGCLKLYLFHSEGALVQSKDQTKEEKNLDIILASFSSTEEFRVYLFDRKKGEKQPC